MFEALLFAPMLRPLLAGAGFAGGYEVSLLAQDLAERDSGFAAILAAQLRGTQ